MPEPTTTASTSIRERDLRLRIICEGTPFENGYQLGIWRCTYEVLRRLSARADVRLWLGSAPVRPLPEGVLVVRDSSRTPTHRRQVLARVRKAMDHYRPPRALVDADVCHATYFAPFPTRAGARVVTVYDMIAERHFAISGGWAEHDIRRKQAAILNADRLLCISQAAADDLVGFHPEVEDRVRIVHPGADHLVNDAVHASPSSRQPYVLFVGHRGQYKNFWLIAEAVRDGAWPRSLRVQVVGPPPEPHETALLRALGVADRFTFLGPLGDTELSQQYRAATCFVFPSLLEGFGLPLLEAQSSHCPVVCSDIAVFREIAGDSACFFDQRRAESLAVAIARVTERTVAEQLVASGHENVRRFSWDRAAEQTLAIYREAVAASALRT